MNKKLFLLLAALALQSCLSGSDDPDIPVLSRSLAWKTFDPAGQGEDRRNLAGRVVWTTLSADTVLCALDEYADHSCRDLRKVSGCVADLQFGAAMVGERYVWVEAAGRECMFDARDGMRLVVSQEAKDTVLLNTQIHYQQRSSDSTTFLVPWYGWVTPSGLVPVDRDSLWPVGDAWVHPSGKEVCVASYRQDGWGGATFLSCFSEPGQPMRVLDLDSVMDGGKLFGVAEWNRRLWSIQRFVQRTTDALTFLDSVRLVSVSLDGGDPHVYPACPLSVQSDDYPFSGAFHLFRAGDGLAIAADKWDGEQGGGQINYNKLLVSISQDMQIQIVGEYQYPDTYKNPEEDVYSGTWIGVPDGELLDIDQLRSANDAYYSGKVLFYRYGADGKLVQ